MRPINNISWVDFTIFLQANERLVIPNSSVSPDAASRKPKVGMPEESAFSFAKDRSPTWSKNVEPGGTSTLELMLYLNRFVFKNCRKELQI